MPRVSKAAADLIVIESKVCPALHTSLLFFREVTQQHLKTQKLATILIWREQRICTFIYRAWACYVTITSTRIIFIIFIIQAPWKYRTYFYWLQNSCITFMLTGLCKMFVTFKAKVIRTLIWAIMSSLLYLLSYSLFLLFLMFITVLY